MADTIKCNCSHCGAKYRLPLEAQGRMARCKKCGNKFPVPRAQSLEDSVITWLNESEGEEETVNLPRVISMPKETLAADSARMKKTRGPIRLKSGTDSSQ